MPGALALPADRADEIVRDPAWFPSGVSWIEQGGATMRCTNRTRLRDAAFLDHRADLFVDDMSATLAFDYPCAVTAPDRYIFHVGFCGSTLLTRLLDMSGQLLALREPQILSEIATARASLDRAGQEDARILPALSTVRALLRRRWDSREAIIVKPSNWANNLLPALCSNPSEIRPLFLTMPRADFVRAIFRGGSERLAFAARAAVHLSYGSAAATAQVATALERPGNDIDRLAALAVVLHQIQETSFADVMRDHGWTGDRLMHFAQLRSDPLGSAAKAAQAFDLALPLDMLAENVTRWSGRHAKAAGSGYSTADEASADAAVQTTYGDRIAHLLDWAEENLPAPVFA